MQKPVIETSAAMRRFNTAVARADTLLGESADRLDLQGLIRALNHAAWSKPQEWSKAARELRASASAVGYRAEVQREQARAK